MQYYYMLYKESQSGFIWTKVPTTIPLWFFFLKRFCEHFSGFVVRHTRFTRWSTQPTHTRALRHDLYCVRGSARLFRLQWARVGRRERVEDASERCEWVSFKPSTICESRNCGDLVMCNSVTYGEATRVLSKTEGAYFSCF